MIAETAKEVQQKAMMAAKAITMEKLGNLMELGLRAYRNLSFMFFRT